MANLIEKLAGSVPSWGTTLAYGEKITVGGQEFVPVALVCFGFGGGEGSGALPEVRSAPAVAGTGEGSGGGAGGFAVPIGAYVGGPETVIFRPNPIALIVAAVPLVAVVGLALARTLRASHPRLSRPRSSH